MLVHDPKFHTATMNRLLDCIQGQSQTDCGKRLGLTLPNVFTVPRLKRIFHDATKKNTAKSVLLDLIDVLNADNTDPSFKGLDLFSKKRSLMEMACPFSQLKDVLSVSIHNKYCMRRLEGFSNHNGAHAFVLMTGFECERRTVITESGAEDVNHYAWHAGTIHSIEGTSFLKTLTDAWHRRHDSLYYKTEVEHPFFQCMSIEEFLLIGNQDIAERRAQQRRPQRLQARV